MGGQVKGTVLLQIANRCRMAWPHSSSMTCFKMQPGLAELLCNSIEQKRHWTAVHQAVS